MIWNDLQNLEAKDFKCGHCGEKIASNKGYFASEKRWGRRMEQYNALKGFIYICHFCDKPTFFSEDDKQVPGPAYGNSVSHISDHLVHELFEEARQCHSYNAFTSSVMCCRKLLMNISVSEGAKEGLYFQNYIDFLHENGYVPPKGKPWVDQIRKLGNTANHKIEPKREEESRLILHFTEMLLRFIYELPGLMENSD